VPSEGYSARTAAEIGRQNLRKLEISAALSERQKARAERAELTADMVIEELRHLAFANMGHYMDAEPGCPPQLADFSKLTEGQLAVLQEVTVDTYVEGRGDDARDVRRVKFKLHSDKRAALVDLGKHLGLFPAPKPDHRSEDASSAASAEQQLLDELATIKARNAQAAKQ
jgi:phage terminase small subunit